MIGHYGFVCKLKSIEHALHDTPGDPLNTEPAIGRQQRIVLCEAHHVFVEDPVRFNVALEVHETIFHDQWERGLHALAQFREITGRSAPNCAVGNAHLDSATRIKGFLECFRVNRRDDIPFGQIS